MVTFKENYDVRVEDETPVSSGMFTFLKGRSYDAVYKKKDGLKLTEISIVLLSVVSVIVIWSIRVYLRFILREPSVATPDLEKMFD